MNYTNIRNLGKSMNQLEKKRVFIGDELHAARLRTKELYSFICDHLTFKQYQKWTQYPNASRFQDLNKVTGNKKLLAAAKEYITLWNRITELNSGYCTVMNQLDSTPSLHLVQSESYSWYELTMLKLNRVSNTRIPRQNPAGLKLVG